ncbi:MAG: peptidylprolyl isomerase, partial [Clostridia bacterium]|nr:peptidylprolyl isomerase [Clostridia bacterium]
EKYGGTPHLDFRFTYNAHTVFGQVYEGLDIVDSIAQVATDPNDKPLEDVIISSIDIEVVE